LDDSQTDGASKGSQGIAAGVRFLGDIEGEWIGGFRENLEFCTSFKAELNAILHGLRLARNLQIQRLWIQVDSIMVVEMLKGNTIWCSHHEPILRQCRAMVSYSGWKVKIPHSYLEANEDADMLANMGISSKLGLIFYWYPLVGT